jgi:hypothetical protein
VKLAFAQETDRIWAMCRAKKDSRTHARPDAHAENSQGADLINNAASLAANGGRHHPNQNAGQLTEREQED